jgi:hypothetical protein
MTVNITLKAILGFIKAGLNFGQIAHIAKHAEVAEIANAVGEKAEAFKDPKSSGEHIVKLAIKAKSIDIVNAVAAHAKVFKDAGLTGDQMAYIAIDAKSVDIVNAVAANAKAFQAAGLKGEEIAHIAIYSKSVPEVTQKLEDARQAALGSNSGTARENPELAGGVQGVGKGNALHT